tara:strand:- start:36 stop:365 length:330 start_codon:yes stop_codon:yes gene_type:complete
MITEDDVEEAVRELIEGADDIGKAAADKTYADEYKKSVKAMVMKDPQFANMPVSGQEREAYDSKEYLEQLNKIREATLKYETLRARRVGLAMLVEVWRSSSANMRAVKL